MHEETQTSNPLLIKLRLPGHTYRLPSHGLFYDTNELDGSVRNGEVEVFPMTAIDEIVMTTPDKLLSGKAITEVFSRCIPQVLKPDQLLSKDVDYLLACLRIVSFGPSMEIRYTHNCEGAKEHLYAIDMDGLVKRAKPIDPTVVNQEFNITMPNGQKVVIQPLTYRSIIELYQTTMVTKQADEFNLEEARRLVVSTLAGIIKSVDDDRDRDRIEEWVFAIPLGWKKMIEDTAQKSSQWGVDFEVAVACKDCEATMKLPVSPNPVSFFS